MPPTKANTSQLDPSRARKGRAMALYKDSTQAANWLLTRDQITTRRSHARNAVLPRLHDAALTSVEEQHLRTHHERRILRLVSCINFPPKVAATAITYFKRYYLDHSIHDTDPSLIALASLYASFKVEEVLLSADDLISQMDCHVNKPLSSGTSGKKCGETATCITVEQLLAIELPFLQRLDFHLICFHPFRSLGIMREHLARTCAHEKEVLSRMMRNTEAFIMKVVVVSDLIFLHPPAVLAAAATLVVTEVDRGDVLAILPEAARVWTMTAVEDMKACKRVEEADIETIARLEMKRRAAEGGKRKDEKKKVTNGEERETGKGMEDTDKVMGKADAKKVDAKEVDMKEVEVTEDGEERKKKRARIEK